MIYQIKKGQIALRVDTLGAQPVSFTGAGGTEYLWTGDPAYWSGQAPVLFPIVGALRAGKAQLCGREIAMAQHGFARRREFTVTEQTDDAITLSLQADEQTREMYPPEFLLSVTYTVTDEGYRTEFCVKNTGSEPMPFAIGGHPGFQIPLGENAAFEDYTIVFAQDEQQRCPGVVLAQGLIDPAATNYELSGREIPLTHELFANDALIFEGLNSKSVQVVNKKSGHGVEMEISQFPLLGIWSPAGRAPFVCLEPWTSCATRTDEGDDFAQKKNMISLAPNESDTRAFTVRVF